MAGGRTVVVVGGGITGLAAAYELSTAGPTVRVTVLEGSDRLGGKVQATPFAGLASVECGADMFLARTPAAVDLARDLGLADDLVAPVSLPAFVWSRGKLHQLPPGLVLGAPARLAPLVRSRLLSWRGKARAAVEPLLPRWRPGGDEGDTLGSAVRARFGDEVLDRLVGPLIGGINAGDPDRLSLRAVTPQIADALAEHRSLLIGLRAQARDARSGAAGAAGQTPASPFLAPRGGVSVLVERLHEAVTAGGGEVRTATPVAALERRDGTWMVEPASGPPIDADAVVLTVPAPDAATLLGHLSPDSAAALRTITAASVAMITLAVPEDTISRPVTASGYLVPRSEQRTITACSWGSSKWAEWRVHGQAVLRISAGRDGDERALDLGDDDLLEAVLSDLDRHIGLRGQPTASRITRWFRAMPQYAPGHLERVDALTATLARDAPGLWLAGAAYRGLGLPACIADGRAAARAALATVGQR
ncbi:MAG TPA: protoporphyrinogen oxidase [Acidimicrobiales bacterium]